MIVVYIAGPYRGEDAWEVAQNVRRAEELAFKAWGPGMMAYCPHANTAHFDGAKPDEVWLEGNLEMLKRCDAVLLVKGWPQSQGTLVEIRLANELGIPVFGLLRRLRNWIDGAYARTLQLDEDGREWIKYLQRDGNG